MCEREKEKKKKQGRKMKSPQFNDKLQFKFEQHRYKHLSNTRHKWTVASWHDEYNHFSLFLCENEMSFANWRFLFLRFSFIRYSITEKHEWREKKWPYHKHKHFDYQFEEHTQFFFVLTWNNACFLIKKMKSVKEWFIGERKRTE